MTPEVYIDYLNKFDVEKVALTNTEILTAIEESLAMQGKGETEIEPRMHIRPRAGVEGHFNVLRGWIGGKIDSAGTKVVGDFVNNYLRLVSVPIDDNACMAYEMLYRYAGNTMVWYYLSCYICGIIIYDKYL